MNVIYADSLFALSLLTDYLLCLATARFCRLTLRRGRYLLAALLGAVYAVAVFLPGLGWLASVPVQLAAAGLMGLAAFGGEARLGRCMAAFLALSATFGGIGGCSEARIQTFIPETNTFETQMIQGMLELVSLTGNIISDKEGKLYHHTHAVFSYKNDGQHCMAAGHMRSITVLYTAEIELRPVKGGQIIRQFDPETGTGFWNFE